MCLLANFDAEFQCLVTLEDPNILILFLKLLCVKT